MNKSDLPQPLILLLAKGRYLKKCAEPMVQLPIFNNVPVPEIKERFKLCDKNGSPVYYIYNIDLVRLKLWRVIKKDNTLAYMKKIDRYYISRRKILSLRKNNPIKRTFKQLRAEKKI